MTDKKGKINTLENSPKFIELVLKIFQEAKIRVRTYKLNELEQDITKLHTKEAALDGFFVSVNIAGIEHQLPDQKQLTKLSSELAKLAKILEVQVTANEIAHKLNGFGNSYSLIPLIDNYVFAYTNAKAIKNGGLLVIKFSSDLGRSVFNILSKAPADDKAMGAKTVAKNG